MRTMGLECERTSARTFFYVTSRSIRGPARNLLVAEQRPLVLKHECGEPTVRIADALLAGRFDRMSASPLLARQST